MPNWCEGTLKLRGKREDILNFLRSEIESNRWIGVREGYELIEIEIKDDGTYINFKTNGCDFYISGTRRNFIDADEFEFYLDEEIEGDQVICINDFKVAWGFTEEMIDPYKKFSEKYNLDFRFYGFEHGMSFNQEWIIENGEIIKFVDIKFDDYEWDCIFPNLGG